MTRVLYGRRVSRMDNELTVFLIQSEPRIPHDVPRTKRPQDFPHSIRKQSITHSKRAHNASRCPAYETNTRRITCKTSTRCPACGTSTQHSVVNHESTPISYHNAGPSCCIQSFAAIIVVYSSFRKDMNII